VAEAAEILLELDGLRKRFGGLAVTDGVSLTLAQGEIHALIGPNGAGKTTLVHQVSGTLAPDAGRVVFLGEDVTRLGLAARARRGLARSFQITSVVPGFSAIENVALAVQARSGSSFRFLRPAGREAALNDAATAALAEVGSPAAPACRPPRFRMGRSGSWSWPSRSPCRPRVLLLDEPLAGTGAEEAERLIRILSSLKPRYGILLIEHDMPAVFALADRISVLAEGRVIASGGVEAIRADAAVRAAYLGEE
jgi:branched-chain amino acid transport system ATP-binding protein